MSLTSLRARRNEEGAIVVAGALVLGLVFIVFVGFFVLMFLAMSSADESNGNKNSTPSARAIADIPPRSAADLPEGGQGLLRHALGGAGRHWEGGDRPRSITTPRRELG